MDWDADASLFFAFDVIFLKKKVNVLVCVGVLEELTGSFAGKGVHESRAVIFGGDAGVQ